MAVSVFDGLWGGGEGIKQGFTVHCKRFARPFLKVLESAFRFTKTERILHQCSYTFYPFLQQVE